eukprot:2845808-Amphidinium_carterae.1
MRVLVRRRQAREQGQQVMRPQRLSPISSTSQSGQTLTGYYEPLDRMAALCKEVTTNTYMPIAWNGDCVVPPYEDFYLDSAQWSTKSIGRFVNGLLGM